MDREPQSQSHPSCDERTSYSFAIVGFVAALVGLALLLAFAPRRASAQDPIESGAFLISKAKDTLVIERFRRTATSLAGTVTAQGAPRLEYVATLGANNGVAALTIDVYAASATADDKALQHVTMTAKGDSMLVELPTGTQRIASNAAAIPGINNAFALFELFTRRVRASGGDMIVPYFSLAGGQTLPVMLSRVGADSIVAKIAGQEQRLHVDAAGRILGGSLAATYELSRLSTAAAANLKVGKPDYSPPKGAPYTAEEVTLKGQNGITLGGTLTLPIGAKGPVPAIVTITGSGQQDRDEYIPVAGGYRPFRQVADTLGRRGIAVLRLDDRTIGASGGAIGTSADYAADVKAALAYLRTRKEIDAKRLGLVGHSEGGLIAPLVATTEPGLAGIVLFAGPAYRGIDIIHFQQRNAFEHDTAMAKLNRDSLAKKAAATLDSAAAKDVWLKFFLTYDPIATARKVKVPVLVLQGQTDQQVTYEQAEKLGAALREGGDKDVTVKVFPEMNHLFIHDPDGNPAGYAKLKSNKMEQEPLGVMAEWLVKHLHPAAP
ncbi:MAG: alpha/beta fold hydrolase [Gemmatimonadetes bacterium]|nr:alpha/beta fold hydrolase [Gemmatimonadota bacterium]MBI3568547.1 alpha/beta fold hydrolase [Gemmatimonadota bacterium]